MADEQKNPSSSSSNNNNNNNNKSSSSSSLNSCSSNEKKKVSSGEIPIGGSKGSGTSSSSFSGHYPNQREASIPDAATLRDQWRYAIRQYSKWNSHAWGAAIFAGFSFYALGWIIKGSNPLPSSSKKQPQQQEQNQDQVDDHK